MGKTMRQEKNEAPATLEYQSKNISKPLSRPGRSTFLGMAMFGTGYFLVAAIVGLTILSVHGGSENGIKLLPVLTAFASGAYLINAFQIGRRHPVPELILITAFGGLLLSIVLVTIGVVDALQPPFFALDLIGPGLLTIFPLVQAVWIMDVVRYARELRGGGNAY
jgi:hypothetical protein